MKYVAALTALAAAAFAKEIPKDPERAAELYDSGIMHERIMADKNEQWDQQEQMGVLNSLAGPQFPELPFAQCNDGLASPVPFGGDNTTYGRNFRCKNVSIVPSQDIKRRLI